MIIDRFGTTYATATQIPQAGGSQDLGVGPTQAPMVELPGGGGFDALGSDQARGRLSELVVRGNLDAASESALDTAWAPFRALLGTRNKLWALMGNGSQRWKWARLLEEPALSEAVHVDWQPLTLRFQLESEVWQGAAHSEVTGLDESPQACGAPNNGNVPVRDAVFTLTAAGTPITAVTVTMTGVSQFTWTGSIGVGKSLVIDCGAGTVKNDGADAYSTFALTANHKIREWLRLAAGLNSVLVARSGGSSASTVTIAYNDGWM